jgi:peptide-methionine (S)-S-oxide reductase
VLFLRPDPELPSPEDALPGRTETMYVAPANLVTGHPMKAPFPEGHETAMVGMGCFRGVERIFWKQPGVWTTAVGYSGGHTPNPTYEEVCSGLTGHNEVVLVVFDPTVVGFEGVLRTFWENHDPTQGMRQGNDVGTQYRSGIYVADDAQRAVAEAGRDAYAARLAGEGFAAVTTEVVDRTAFYYAEAHHQQYLARNPMGYCGIGGTGVSCPTGVLG